MTTSSSFLLGLLFAAVTLQNVTPFSISTPRQRATSSPVSRINKFPAALALHAISTPIETETQYAKMQRTGKAANVVIIGGGPAGLASAIMLARRGYTNVKSSIGYLNPPLQTMHLFGTILKLGVITI